MMRPLADLGKVASPGAKLTLTGTKRWGFLIIVFHVASVVYFFLPTVLCYILA